MAKKTKKRNINIVAQLGKEKYKELLYTISTKYNKGKTSQDIAAEYGIPAHCVGNISYQLRSAGVDIPKARRYGIILEFITELKEKHPKLMRKTK